MTPGIPPAGRAFVEIAVGDLPATVLVTTRRAGDLRPGAPGAPARRDAVAPGPPWSWGRQVHGATVLSTEQVAAACDGLVGRPRERPAMFAADCALVAVLSEEGIVAAVHVGWRGLREKVLEAAAGALRERGASRLYGVRGACIGAECYEFGEEDLAGLVALYGDVVRSRTRDGRPALDMAAGVRAACETAGIELVHEIASCTACARDEDGGPLWFSHRARGDLGRHALVVTPRT